MPATATKVPKRSRRTKAVESMAGPASVNDGRPIPSFRGRRDGRHPSPERGRRGRSDLWSGRITGLSGHNSKTSCTDWDPTFRQPRVILEDFHEGNAIGARIVDREPHDATANGYKLKDIGPEENEALEEWHVGHRCIPKLREAGAYARLFGGGGIYMSIDDGRDASEPVDEANIREFRSITSLDRYDLRGDAFVTDLDRGMFWSPTRWRLTQTGQIIHPDRILIFQGIRARPQRMATNGGWGFSMIDRIWNDLQQYDTTHQFLAEAITRLTQGVLKMEEYDRAMKREDAESVLAELEALSEAMSAIGDIVIGKNDSYDVIQRGVTGFKDAADVFVSRIVAATDMPRSILLGETVGGMNAGENAGDWQSWSSHLAWVQDDIYTPPLRKMLGYALAAENSPLADMPAKIRIEWNPLQQMSEIDESTVLVNTSNAAGTLVLNRIITSEEARDITAIREGFSLTGSGPAARATEPESVGEGDIDEARGEGDDDIAVSLDAQRNLRQVAAFNLLRRIGEDQAVGE